MTTGNRLITHRLHTKAHKSFIGLLDVREIAAIELV